MMRLARVMDEVGIFFSPHNPSGPVCHAVSLQVSAAVTRPHSLEVQFGETPVVGSLSDRGLQQVTSGEMVVSGSPGIGMGLCGKQLSACRSSQWTMSRAG